jgi:hypothetical protein
MTARSIPSTASGQIDAAADPLLAQEQEGFLQPLTGAVLIIGSANGWHFLRIIAKKPRKARRNNHG